VVVRLSPTGPFRSLAIGTYWAACSTAVLVAAALTLVAGLPSRWEERRLGVAFGEHARRAGRILCGLALIPFGIAHFQNVRATAALVPGWLPAHVAWAYFTGATFNAAGIAMVTGMYAREAAALAAWQMGLFLLLVWIPRLAAGSLSAFQRGEVITTWVLTAAVWVLAASYQRNPSRQGKPATVSGVAGSVALIRALETAKPANERLFDDPFARRFLPFWRRVLMIGAGIQPWRRLLESIHDRRAPGARTSGAARTRLIDEWIRATVDEGVRQVLILGAGFDCRALRLPELETCTVFELDQRATLDAKSRLIAEMSAAHIRRVPIDFLNEQPARVLAGSGYSSTVPSLFLWEGVTNYLQPAAVDAVFDVVRRSAPGSRVIFTYVHADAIDGTFPAPGLPALLAQLREMDEPWTFGFRPEDVPQYLAQRDIRLCEDLGAADYRARYWPRPTAPEGYEFYRVVLAEVQEVDR
jgi:methyltransferase (TIGR00027 family)